jgi:type I restriction enzyme, S subunit
MSNNGKLAPKLRFPEFREGPGWDEVTLGSQAKFHKGRGVSKAEVDPKGKRECIRYGELYTRYGEVITDVFSRTNAPDTDLFLSCVNDVILPASGETKEDIAKASCVMKAGVALGSDLNVIRTEHNGVFLSYFLNSARRRAIAKVAQGDTVVHLYPSQLEQITIAIPDEDEQQKIADCLSSLDDLIAAEGRKWESLRAYKKALIQQLLPRDGETTPRLRFPEFQGKGEWAIRKLSDFIIERNEVAGAGIPLFSLTIEKGVTAKTERYERSFLVNDEESAYKVVRPNDFAFNPMNLRFGAIARHAGQDVVALSKYYNIFYCDHTMDPRFCGFYFKTDDMVSLYDRIATGSLIEKRRVHFDRFLKLDLPFPALGEQQLIADCFLILDERIDAQSEKLAALRAHKKGLMQQLFPSAEETEA